MVYISIFLKFPKVKSFYFLRHYKLQLFLSITSWLPFVRNHVSTQSKVRYCSGILEVLIKEFSRSIPSEVFLGKVVLKICSKFTVEHPCQSVISMKLQSNFTELALWNGRFPVILLHIFRKPFPMSTSGGLLLFRTLFMKQYNNALLFT